MFVIKAVLNSGNFVVENNDGAPVCIGTLDHCLDFIRAQFPRPEPGC